MSEERICETCKHTELSGCDYPCHCCAVVYQNTGFSDMWEQAGCEFCNDVLQFSEFDKGSSVFMNNGELIVEDCDGNEVAMLEINFCPMCGAKL